jgi:glycine/D-amino acid oxidase-like deaminating enzyme
MRVLICGGGVIGACIAYFLSCRGIAATVFERSGVGCAASGKAGGFLALDWCDGTPLEALARRSFALHARLAEELDGDWGYRRLTTYSGSMGLGLRRNLYEVEWLSPSVAVNQRLGSTASTAQVHPEKFTSAMMKAAEAQGAELRIGQVTGVVRRNGGKAIKGVEVDGKIVEGDAVVIALGPWSILAAEWLSLPAVYGLKGHSLVFETGAKVPAEALFVECREANGMMQAPEVFPRADGTTYVCAIPSKSPLPIDPARVVPDPDAIERLQAVCSELSPVLAGSKILARAKPASDQSPRTACR